jgi:hypothetical protein
LKCFHRQPNDPVPICGIEEGEVEAKTDFCVPQGAPDNLLGPSISYQGQRNNPSQPLDLCEGDCDSDADCVPGLICFQRNPGQPVPGCRGFDGSRTDYCINPSAQNTPSLPVSGSNEVIMFLNYTISSNFDSRRPTDEEYDELVVQTDKWFTDETDRLFGTDTTQLQDVVVTILKALYKPNQSAQNQIRYSVTIAWTAATAAGIPRDSDILTAFQPFPFMAPDRYNTVTYQSLYLISLPRTNPFFFTTNSIGRGMSLS